VYETDTQLVVRVEIAGMTEDAFDVSLDDRRLVIAGHRRPPDVKVTYQNMEIRYGEFRTEVVLGRRVDGATVEASYSEGFLSVYLPKIQEFRVPIASRTDRGDAS
jgi:HSP20 family molecular chaperone IbpA